MKYILAILLCSIPINAHAADGKLGTTSTGTAQITLVIEPTVFVHKLTDEEKKERRVDYDAEIWSNIQYKTIEMKNDKNQKVTILIPE